MKENKFASDSSVAASFARVKEALEEQKRMILLLEKNQSRLESSSSENNKRVSDWIAYFEASLLRLDKAVSALKEGVSVAKPAKQAGASVDPAQLKAELSRSLDNALAVQLEELEAFKQALKQELVVFSAKTELKTVSPQAEPPIQPIINVNNANNVTPVMQEAHYTDYNGLSNPEKWLVGVLFNAEAPLSYAQIAERTGKTVSTARVYMNQLKIKGFVEESSLPNGVKIFSLKHDAKVKKLYNL